MSSQEHRMITHIEQVKLYKTTYLGSIDLIKIPVYCVEEEKNNKLIVLKEIEYVKAFEHMFMEIMTNAMDNVYRSKKEGIKCSFIEVIMDRKKISVKNDGKVIEIKKYKCNEDEDEEIKRRVKGRYIVDIIFSEMLTSSNYNKSDNHTTAGKFGYGAKVTNINSKEFSVEVADGKKKYNQTWYNQLTEKGDEIIISSKEKYTKISYTADFSISNGNINEYSDEIISAFEKICIDAAMCTGIKVIFNEHEYHLKNGLLDYCLFYLPNFKEGEYFHLKENNYDILIVPSASFGFNDFSHISFVNGFYTSSGGVHVDIVCNVILRPVVEYINSILSKKLKDGNYKSCRITDVKKNVFLFINCIVVEPECDLEKTTLKGPKEMEIC